MTVGKILLIALQRSVLDGSLGFAAGVMTAASFWSLLAPAIELAESSGNYGAEGEWAFLPVAVGFFLGALFVYGADLFMTSAGLHSPNIVLGKMMMMPKYFIDILFIPYEDF